MRYRDIGAVADRVLASAWFFIAFNVALAGLLAVSANAGNVFISIVTADAVLLGAAGARAAWKALHAKLDELLVAVTGAREELVRAEDMDEERIAELRR